MSKTIDQALDALVTAVGGQASPTSSVADAIDALTEAMAGGGALADLGDVALDDPEDGDVLVYDGTLGKWVDGAAGGGGKTKVFFEEGYESDGTTATYRLTNAAAVLDMLEAMAEDLENIPNYDIYCYMPGIGGGKLVYPVIAGAMVGDYNGTIAVSVKLSRMTTNNDSVLVVSPVGTVFTLVGDMGRYSNSGDQTSGFASVVNKTREELDALIGEDGTLVIEQTL